MTIIAEQLVKKYPLLVFEPPLHNSALFVQTNGWNNEKLFRRFFTDKTPYPIIVTTKGEEGILYIATNKNRAMLKEVFRNYWEEKGQYGKLLQEFSSLQKDVDELYEQLSYEFIAQEEWSLVNEALGLMLEKTWSLNALAFFTFVFDRPLCEELVQELQIAVDLDASWTTITTPRFSSLESRQKILFDKLAQELSGDRLAQAAQFMVTSYNDIPTLDSVLPLLQERFAAVSPASKQKKATLPEDKATQRLMTFIQELMRLRDVRKDQLLKLVVSAYRIAERVFSEAGVEKELILFSTIDEMRRGKEVVKATAETFRRRKAEGFTMVVDYDGSVNAEFGSFEATNNLMSSRLFSQEKRTDDMLVGSTGCPGKVTGKVRVIRNFKTEKERFRNGEILVAGMTRPEFVPLMKKAVAIVTDEGGITCHAAVVSRELGIPCVVGTKVATQVLKDGDLVEVDAEKGAVRKIG